MSSTAFIFLIVIIVNTVLVTGFATFNTRNPVQCFASRQSTTLSPTLYMSGGKGFGKKNKSKKKRPANTDVDTPTNNNRNISGGGGLQSIDSGPYSIEKKDVLAPDPNASVEERTAQILKDQYGLQTIEEKQSDFKRKEARRNARKKLDEMKRDIELDKPLDILGMIPDLGIVVIDGVLKFGLAGSTVLFILAGFGICVEAWSKATGGILPDKVDAFIANTIEPGFTPLLGILLLFSVSLGLFATAQLGSESSRYTEKR